MASRSKRRGDPVERGSRNKTRAPGGSQLGLVVGVRPVAEALRAGRRELYRLVWRQGAGPPRPGIRALLELAEQRGVASEGLSPERFEQRLGDSTSVHQGVALEASPLPTLRLQEIETAFERAHTLVALDGVEDPQNLGAIARVAVGAGVAGLILPKRRSAPLSSAAARASAGAIEHLPIAIVPNLREAVTRLQKVGFRAIGADPRGATSLYEDLPASSFSTPGEDQIVLVLGAEGSGLRPSLLAALDHTIQIPMASSIASLNVSTAAAVILFEYRRRRGLPRGSPT